MFRKYGILITENHWQCKWIFGDDRQEHQAGLKSRIQSKNGFTNFYFGL
jgi:hypothetical protein